MVIDIIAITVSTGALIVAFVNYRKYRELTVKSNEIMQSQALTAQGALETQIRSVIADATREVVLIGLEVAKGVEVAKNVDNPHLKNAYCAAEEMYRNAYEDACSMYIDGKVDIVRFKKMYQREIRRLVEEEPHKEYYSTNQTPYTSTLEVYKKWYSEA